MPNSYIGDTACLSWWLAGLGFLVVWWTGISRRPTELRKVFRPALEAAPRVARCRWLADAISASAVGGLGPRAWRGSNGLAPVARDHSGYYRCGVVERFRPKAEVLPTRKGRIGREALARGDGSVVVTWKLSLPAPRPLGTLTGWRLALETWRGRTSEERWYGT